MPLSAREWKRRQGSGLSPTCSNPAIFTSASTRTDITARSEEDSQARTRAEEGKQTAIINASSQREEEEEIRGRDGEQLIKKKATSQREREKGEDT